jgi:protein-tyrosine-phosphatase
MSAFLDKTRNMGAITHQIEITQVETQPCIECNVCLKKGFCSITDDMQKIFGLFRKADIVVIGTPIFFYGPTAQLKALVDRSQTLWTRKYVHKLTDPGRKWRKGFMLAVGATKGENLFDGADLVAKYFFDAIGSDYAGFLGYRKVEALDAIKDHPTAIADVRKKAQELTIPLLNRKKILFLCTENACRSQMAAAFARFIAGGKVETKSAGSRPSDEINPTMVAAMAEKGIDMAYIKPRSINNVLEDGWQPDLIVSMGCGDGCPYIPGVVNEEWPLPDPAGKSLDFMRKLRDEIDARVKKLLDC